jgi:hypothetical protein
MLLPGISLAGRRRADVPAEVVDIDIVAVIMILLSTTTPSKDPP